MSLSVSRHSEGSITNCDEFESDDVIQGSGTFVGASRGGRRRTSGALDECRFQASSPNVSHPHSKMLHKGNISVQSENSARSNLPRRRRKALDTLYMQNSSEPLSRNGKRSTTLRSKVGEGENSKRERLSFEIYRQEESPECSFCGFGQFVSPIKGEEPKVGLMSPEYEPATFFDAVNQKLEKDSVYQAADSVWDCEKQIEQLVEMFPNVDPEFLKMESNRMRAPLDDVVNSILIQMEQKSIPAKENKKGSEASNSTKAFSVEKLLKITGDPWSYFADKGRNCSGYTEHSLHYLKTKFRKFYNQTITDSLLFHNQNLYLAYQYLKKKNRGLKLRMTNRPLSECNACKPNTVNLQFLLEVSFIEHEEEVRSYVKNRKASKKLRLKEAARLNLLVECECCYGEGLLPEDVVTCRAGHTFCKECVARYIESGMENGMSQAKCLGPCDEEYPLKVVQEVLSPGQFSKLMETHQSTESACLARCPFCSHIMFLPPEVTLVTCLNVQCLKESCRICKAPNHEPVKCELRAALSVRCWQCNEEVTKEEGCNEMICSCGGKTCYVCRQPVGDHSHFFIVDVENDAKCPLYSTD